MDLETARRNARSLLVFMRPWVTQGWMVGSLRREEPSINDIDLLVLTKEPEVLCAALYGKAGKWQRYKNRIQGNVGGIRVDIFFITKEEEAGAALLAWTGSAKFNVTVRRVAKSKGLLLNERGLWTRSEPRERLAGRSEKEILDVLGLKWLHPSRR